MTSPSKRKHVRFDCSDSSSAITTTTTADTVITSRSLQSISSLLRNYSGSGIKNNLQNPIQSYFPCLLSSKSDPAIKETSLSSLAPTSPSSLSLFPRKSSDYQQIYQQQTFPLPNPTLPQRYHLKSIIKNSHTFTLITDPSYDNNPSSSGHYFTTQALASIPPILQTTAISSRPIRTMNNLPYFNMGKSSRSKSQPHQNTDDHIQVRRMSLAEFTGLEGYVGHNEKPKDYTVPEKPMKTIKNDQTSSSMSLIDTYSNRRRPNVLNTFEEIKCTELRKATKNKSAKKSEHINFHQIDEKVKNLRKQLEKTMNDLPNQSPKKSLDCENEKAELLVESRKLAGACKAMLSEIHDSRSEKNWSEIIVEVLEAAEGVTHGTERMIQKSNSIFQAQLMATKTEQMLKSLSDVLQSMQEVETKDDDSMKVLTARSTTLTANVRQLLSTVPYT